MILFHFRFHLCIALNCASYASYAILYRFRLFTVIYTMHKFAVSKWFIQLLFPTHIWWVNLCRELFWEFFFVCQKFAHYKHIRHTKWQTKQMNINNHKIYISKSNTISFILFLFVCELCLLNKLLVLLFFIFWFKTGIGLLYRLQSLFLCFIMIFFRSTLGFPWTAPPSSTHHNPLRLNKYIRKAVNGLFYAHGASVN